MQEPIKARSIGTSCNLFAALQTHIFKALVQKICVRFRPLRFECRRNIFCNLKRHSGICSPGYERREIFGVNFDDFIEFRAFVGFQSLPVFDGFFPIFAFRRESVCLSNIQKFFRPARSFRRALRLRCSYCRRVILPSIERFSMASPAYSMTYPVAPSVPISLIIPKNHIFCRYAERQFARRRLSAYFSISSAANIASPERVRLRSCRCRTPARRTRRVSKCANRRKQSSFRAASNLVRVRKRE